MLIPFTVSVQLKSEQGFRLELQLVSVVGNSGLTKKCGGIVGYAKSGLDHFQEEYDYGKGSRG